MKTNNYCLPKWFFLLFSVFFACCFLSLKPGFSQHPDWENPAVYERNQTMPHVPLTPFAKIEDAAANNKEACEYYLSLNGTWKFHWAETPEKAPEDFYSPQYDVSGWDEIPVPSNWQMEGYGYPKFRNITLEFPSNPPMVPDYFNPVGSYKRTFVLPQNWDGRRVFLHFEGIKSAAYVWINGKEAGYNEGGFEPAEFDVTPFLLPGENTIAVKVLRYSDGSYIENQDMWRLSGIYRSVYLFSAPPLHIRDYYVYTDFDNAYVDATLHVEVEMINYSDENLRGYTLQAELLDTDQQKIDHKRMQKRLRLASQSIEKIAFETEIEAPEQWSAESPNLYYLRLSLTDRDDNMVEVYQPKIGFRETEVKGQAVYVNGQPVKFNGVNSHVHHPETGKTMDMETIRKDFELMKQFNINLVRFSHYPPNTEYLQLADEYGLYVVDETGDECHGNIYLSEDTAWRAAFVDRARKMVIRDRNHPSIVFWSAGNEAGNGKNIQAVIQTGQELDPSRPDWMYGGNTFMVPYEQIVGPRYWAPFELKKLAEQDPVEDSRPSFMDEYLAATGNGLGALDDYWELIYKYPRLTGGAIWDWVSPSIKMPLRLVPDKSPNNNPGALMGRSVFIDGKFGQAVSFSGNDEWIEFYRSEALDISDNNLTIDCWVNPRPFIHRNDFVTKGSHQYGLLMPNADTVEFYIYSDKRVSVKSKVPGNWVDNWHHLAGSYDGEMLRLYLDGDLVDSTAFSGTIMQSPFPVTFGRNSETDDSETTGQLSNARLDRVRIFDAAYTPEELNAVAPEDAALWVDFDEVRTEGDFYMTGLEGRTYGTIWADRSVQPEMWQIKKSAQPVAVEEIYLKEGKLKVINRMSFLSTKTLEGRWEIRSEGETLANGMFDVDVAPLSEGRLNLPIEMRKYNENQDYWLTVSFHLKEDEIWAKKGHEVAWNQFLLKKKEKEAEKAAGDKSLVLDAGSEGYIIQGDGFRYVFDHKNGSVSSIKINGGEMLNDATRFNVWRAPLANDIDPWNNFEHRMQPVTPGLGRSRDNHFRTTGTDVLHYQLDDIQAEQIATDQIRIIIKETAYTNEKEGGFSNTYTWLCDADGRLEVDLATDCQGLMPEWLPKIGLQLDVKDTYENIAWYGRGPFENYPDRKTGAKAGVYSSSVEDFYVPYLIPQDYGNRCDVTWVELTSANGSGLRIEGNNFNFSAQQYSTANLERAMYPFQLKEQDSYTLNLDHQVTGVGDTSKSVLRKYRVPATAHRFSFVFMPVF